MLLPVNPGAHPYAASVPVDEAARLEALSALELTPAGDERFDRIARLARRLASAPVALVSVVGEEEMWAIGCAGLGERTVPRTQSFCAHALASPEPLVIPDLGSDPRFAGHPLVAGPPHFRFYAGHPIAEPGGRRVGTVCVLDDHARTLDADELAALADLARLAELELASERLSEALQARRGAERRLKSMVDSAADAVVTLDAGGRVTYANPAAGRLLGCLRSDLVGRRVDELEVRDDGSVDDLLERWRAARAGVLRRLDSGEPVHVAATVASLDDGSGGWVATLRDVSERRALETLRHNLLSSVSHELRTPLTGVLGFLDALIEGDGGDLTPDQAELAAAAAKSGRRLDAVVVHLLRIVELDAPQAPRSARTLRLVDLVEPLPVRFPDAALDLGGDAGAAQVLGDEERLGLAIAEIVTNAIVHGPPGGRISVRAVEHDESAVAIEVRDDGPGIPADEAPYVTERFYRGRDAGTRPGLGLGLALAREIAEQHGGILAVDGPRVRLVLPRRAA